MAFVFEAKKLPFEVEEDAATRARVLEWLGESSGRTLTPWQRCLFAAVMPVVLQRPLPAGQRHNREGATVPETSNKDQNGNIIIQEHTHEENESPGTDTNEKVASASAVVQREPETEDIDIAFRILAGLDDLEAAYAHARDVRRQMRAPSRYDAALPQDMTAEEILMSELLRERGGEEAVAGFFAVTRPLNDEDSAADGEEDVDLAMCFDSQGNPIGMGAPVVFGGHGYHAEP